MHDTFSVDETFADTFDMHVSKPVLTSRRLLVRAIFYPDKQPTRPMALLGLAIITLHSGRVFEWLVGFITGFWPANRPTNSPVFYDRRLFVLDSDTDR